MLLLRFHFAEFSYVQARAKEFVSGGDVFRAACIADFLAMAATLGALAQERFHLDVVFDKQLYHPHDPAFPLRLLPRYASATKADFPRFCSTLPARWADAQSPSL
ncbi:MAG: hypothetical protein ABIQ12_05130 [Opitutaceae bacterium]